METFEKETLPNTARLDKDKPVKVAVYPETRKEASSLAPALPQSLRYFMLGLLVVGVAGAIVFAFVRQTSVKPVAANVNGENCADPVTENRLRDTLSKSPNDFATLSEWGAYNLRCREPADYLSAISAYQGATRIADNPANNIPAENRLEAHLDLGLAYLYSKNFKQAQVEFRTTLNEQPKNSFALLAMGAALAKDEPEQALTYLKQAIEVAPADSKVRENAQALINDIAKGQGSRPSPAAKS